MAEFSANRSVCVAEFLTSSQSILSRLGIGLSVVEILGRGRTLGVVAQRMAMHRLVLFSLFQKAEFFQAANTAYDSADAAPYELGKRLVGRPAIAFLSG